MTHATVADLLRPAAKAHALAYDVFVVLAGSVLVALTAQVALPLPFTPVPITGQTFGVLLVGALLGSRRGAAALLAYLAEGAAGLPVFAGATGGAWKFAGPTGGYLVGFVLAAWITGRLAEAGWDRGYLRTATAMALGTLAIFACGWAWLTVLVGPVVAFGAGVAPFAIGGLVKIALAAALLPSGWKLLGNRRK